MAKNSFLNKALTVLLAVATTALVCGVIVSAMIRSSSKPMQVTGVMKTGWPFTIIAMDGNQTVELEHEWSGRGGRHTNYLGAAASDSGSDAETRAAERKPFDGIVWADTGQANKPLRYYLSPADLLVANSQLDDSNPTSFRNVEIEVLEDDPIRKAQTLKVIDHDNDDDIVNLYRIEGERVTPLTWSQCRTSRLASFVLLFTGLPVFLASYFLWRGLLRGRI